MSLPHISSSWIRPNALYLVALIACLVLAFKLYSNAFSSSIFASLTKRRLAEILRPAASRSTIATPAASTAVPYSENQKAL
jgi:hypothetical protein